MERPYKDSWPDVCVCSFIFVSDSSAAHPVNAPPCLCTRAADLYLLDCSITGLSLATGTVVTRVSSSTSSQSGHQNACSEDTPPQHFRACACACVHVATCECELLMRTQTQKILPGRPVRVWGWKGVSVFMSASRDGGEECSAPAKTASLRWTVQLRPKNYILLRVGW